MSLKDEAIALYLSAFLRETVKLKQTFPLWALFSIVGEISKIASKYDWIFEEQK